jgi:drug/metabolite transporter (DMT)-like permease
VSRPDGAARAQPPAAVLAVAASALFAAMAMVARLLARTLSGPQIAMVRFAIGIVVVVGLVVSGRAALRPRRWGWLVSRGVFGGTAVVLYFASIARIGVGVATLLNYTSPVWSMVFAWLLLGERPRRAALVALAMTLMGVGLLAGGTGVRWHIGGWEITAALSAVLSGMAITSIRASRMPAADGSAGEDSITVFASFTTIGFLATLPVVLLPYGGWTAPSPSAWALLGLCGLLSVAAQLLMTSALGRLTTVGMGILQQSTVVLAMTGGMLAFGETLSPRGLLGCAITMAGVVTSILSDRRSTGADS